MKKGKRRNIIWIIIDTIIILVVIYFILGYVNFYKISKEKKPLFNGQVTTYEKGVGNITVNKYFIYKIVKYEVPDQNVTYSMKLWFMDDIK